MVGQFVQCCNNLPHHFHHCLCLPAHALKKPLLRPFLPLPNPPLFIPFSISRFLIYHLTFRLRRRHLVLSSAVGVFPRHFRFSLPHSSIVSPPLPPPPAPPPHHLPPVGARDAARHLPRQVDRRRRARFAFRILLRFMLLLLFLFIFILIFFLFVVRNFAFRFDFLLESDLSLFFR